MKQLEKKLCTFGLSEFVQRIISDIFFSGVFFDFLARICLVLHKILIESGFV